MQKNIINWHYKPTTLDTTVVPEISQELLNLYNHVYSLDTTRKNTVACMFDDVQTVIKYCPTLIDELKRLKIDHLLDYVVFTTCDPSLPSMPIHRDFSDQKVVCFGLNIPVKNCDNSFIIWYQADVNLGNKMPDYSLGSRGVDLAISIDKETAIEIARMTCDQPYWINNFVPHNGMALHTRTRIMSSIRFTPEIINLIDNGYFDNFLVG